MDRIKGALAALSIEELRVTRDLIDRYIEEKKKTFFVGAVHLDSETGWFEWVADTNGLLGTHYFSPDEIIHYHNLKKILQTFHKLSGCETSKKGQQRNMQLLIFETHVMNFDYIIAEINKGQIQITDRLRRKIGPEVTQEIQIFCEELNDVPKAQRTLTAAQQQMNCLYAAFIDECIADAPAPATLTLADAYMRFRIWWRENTSTREPDRMYMKERLEKKLGHYVSGGWPGYRLIVDGTGTGDGRGCTDRHDNRLPVNC